jgi:protein O-GlcNAc transferase
MTMTSDNFSVALEHFQAGRLHDAELVCRQILARDAKQVDATHLLGMVAAQTHRLDLAIDLFTQASRLDPNHAGVCFNLGGALRFAGRMPEAESWFRRAATLQADFVEAHFWLGNLLSDQRRWGEAVKAFEQALHRRPDHAAANVNLGTAWKALGKLAEAGDSYERAVQLQPENVPALTFLSEVRESQGRWSDAADCYVRILKLRPGQVATHNNLGNVWRRLGRLAEAQECFDRALHLEPRYRQALVNLGVLHNDLGRYEQAAACFEKALEIDSTYEPALNNLGIVRCAEDRLAEAAAFYRRAIKCDSAYADAHSNLGNVLRELGDSEAAAASYARALKLKPDDGLKIRAATILPVVPKSIDDLRDSRARFEANVQRLLGEKLHVDDPATQIGTIGFYLAYQGLNDRQVQADLARLFMQAAPSLNYMAPHCIAEVARSGRRPIRVGFISRYFHQHSIGRVNAGLIEHLSRDLFETTVFRFPGPQDSLSSAVDRAADRVVTLPFQLRASRERLAQAELDILLYTDLGMDPWTNYLAFSRLAPVQCTTWGHPVTSGIPTIDYFISSHDLETADAEQYYTEQLVRMQELTTYYRRPPTPTTTKARADYGLHDGPLYVCPQSLFKIHPEFDFVLRDVLRADPRGRVVLFEGQQTEWTRWLRERLQRTVAEVFDRIVFLPRQSSDDLLRLVSLADVVLDTIHFSGGVTTLEILSTGTPIVTLPGEFLRGRQTYACYRKMGVDDCIARDLTDYVQRAVTLANDRDRQREIRDKIMATNSVLYENLAAVRELEQFLVRAVREKQPPLSNK